MENHDFSAVPEGQRAAVPKATEGGEAHSLQASPEALVISLLQVNLRSAVYPHVCLQEYLQSPHRHTVPVSPEVLDGLIVAETITRLRDSTRESANLTAAVSLQQLRQEPRVVNDEQKNAAALALSFELARSCRIEVVTSLINDFNLDIKEKKIREGMERLVSTTFRRLSDIEYARNKLKEYANFIPFEVIKGVGLEILASRIFDLAAGKEDSTFRRTALTSEQIIELLDVQEDELKHAALQAVSTVAEYSDCDLSIGHTIIRDYSLDAELVQQAVTMGLTEAILRSTGRGLRIKAVLDSFSVVVPTSELVALAVRMVPAFIERGWFEEANEIVTAFEIEVTEDVAAQLKKKNESPRGGGF